MPHLIETYGNYCGVKLPKTGVVPVEKFYPIPDKYITIHPSSAQPTKVYDYFLEVLSWIKPELDKLSIKVVQVGYLGDTVLSGCENYTNKCDFSQTCYVIKHSMLHLGMDSVYMHIAGLYDIPTIALFGPTLPTASGPYYKNAKTILLESDRKGLRPSLGSFEKEKSINLIKPEEVIGAIFKLLDIPNNLNLTTKFIGANYHNFIFEVIPDQNIQFPLDANGILNMRLDRHFDENVASMILSKYKCTLVTDKAISPLLFNQNVDLVIYEVKKAQDINFSFLNFLVKRSIKYKIMVEADNEELNNIKLKLFDYNPVSIKLKFEAKSLGENLRFKSSRLLISGDKIYLSYWHYLNKKHQENVKDLSNTLPDTNDLTFWENQDNMYVYETK